MRSVSRCASAKNSNLTRVVEIRTNPLLRRGLLRPQDETAQESLQLIPDSVHNVVLGYPLIVPLIDTIKSLVQHFLLGIGDRY